MVNILGAKVQKTKKRAPIPMETRFFHNLFPDFDKMCTYKITYPNFQAFSKNNLCKWVTQRLFFVSLHHVCT